MLLKVLNLGALCNNAAPPSKAVRLEKIDDTGSGLAAAKGKGLVSSLGYLGESDVYIPSGPVRDLAHAALSMSDDTVHSSGCGLIEAMLVHLPARTDIRVTSESMVKSKFLLTLPAWWPEATDREDTSTDGEDTCTPTDREDTSTPSKDASTPPLVAKLSNADVSDTFFCNSNPIDFCVVYAKCPQIVLFAAELKNTAVGAIEAYSQAFMAGAAGVVALRSAGLSVDDCVVPVLMHNGLQEQFGAVHLLEHSMPCFVIISPIFSLNTARGAMAAAKFRIAARDFALRTAARVKTVFHGDTVSQRVPTFSPQRFVVKPLATSIFGVDSGEHHSAAVQSTHELRLFEQLLTHRVDCVVYPCTRLMRAPDEGGNGWHEPAAMVYPRLGADFAVGIPPAGRDAWLAAVTEAVYAVHAAGVVHCDLFPCNIMSRRRGDSFDIKLVDLEASMAIGEVVPEAVGALLADSGRKAFYHPGFRAGQRAARVFDLWFIAALSMNCALTFKREDGAFFETYAGDIMRRACELEARAPLPHRDP